MAKDPVCGMEIDVAVAARTVTYNDNSYYFCAPGCLQIFLENPQRYLEEMKPARKKYQIKGLPRVTDKGRDQH